MGRRPALALLEILRGEGVDRVFGNPGTTELPFLAALMDAEDAPEYVLGIHEGAVVSMADGYARATGRPAFVSLHIAAGLANGLIGLLNARRSRTPLVVMAGQQDRRHLQQDPMLSGDLDRPRRARREGDLRRPARPRPAARACAAPSPSPYGRPPGRCSSPYPWTCSPRTPRSRSRPARRHPAPRAAVGLDRAAVLLGAAARPVIVAGDGVGRENADRRARPDRRGLRRARPPPADGRLPELPDHPPPVRGHAAAAPRRDPRRPHAVRHRAHRRGARVHPAPLQPGSRAAARHHGRTARLRPGRDRPQLPRRHRARRRPRAPRSTGSPSCCPSGLPAHTAKARVLRASERHTAERNRTEAAARAAYSPAPLAPWAAAHAVARGLPPDAVVVEEAITVGLLLRRLVRLDRPGSYTHTVGGGLGWGIGAAVGRALAEPGRPVVAVLGDGCALFGLQGLWSAARSAAPVLFVVMNNGAYRTLQDTYEAMGGQGRLSRHRVGRTRLHAGGTVLRDRRGAGGERGPPA